MDYHLLAILEQSEESDFDSETEFPTVVSGFSEIQSKGDLVNQPDSGTKSLDQATSGQQD